MPFGLGDDLAAINAILEERKSAEARAHDPKDLAINGDVGRGRNRCSDTTPIGADRGADYLTARIARDRPDVLARMRAGEFRSVRAAARAAGIVRDRVSVPLDPARAAAILARRFDRDGIEALIAGLREAVRRG